MSSIVSPGTGVDAVVLFDNTWSFPDMIEPSDTFLGAGASVIALDLLLYRVYSLSVDFLA